MAFAAPTAIKTCPTLGSTDWIKVVASASILTFENEKKPVVQLGLYSRCRDLLVGRKFSVLNVLNHGLATDYSYLPNKRVGLFIPFGKLHS